MIGKREKRNIKTFENVGITDEDKDIIGRLLTIQSALTEHIQRAGLYMAYNNPPRSMSKPKNERQLPNGHLITEEMYDESMRWLEQLGPKMDTLYNSLTKQGKIRFNDKELTRPERNRSGRYSKAAKQALEEGYN